MTLDEAFEKYPDTARLRRLSHVNKFPKDCDKELLADYLKSGGGSYDIEWLKGFKSWGTEEARKLGFFIPHSMIDDANADDWGLVEAEK